MLERPKHCFMKFYGDLMSSQKTNVRHFDLDLLSESNLQHFRKWWLSLSVSVRKDLKQNVKKYRSIVWFSDIILLGRDLLLYVFSVLEVFLTRGIHTLFSKF